MGTVRILATFLAAMVLSAPAGAQLFRAYLASTGLDTNPCTRPAPCRLLPAALSAVADGGEVWMLDSANFNTTTVVIGKSVTVTAVPGAVGSVVVPAGANAITVSGPGIKVALRNLSIGPLPGVSGFNGINMASGIALSLEGCLVANLSGAGVIARGFVTLRVVDTTIRGNSVGMAVSRGARAIVARSVFSGNASHGINIFGDLGGVTTSLDVADSVFDGNSQGITADAQVAAAPVKVTVRGSRLVRHAGAGLLVLSTGGVPAIVTATGNVISHNAVGIDVQRAGSVVQASGNSVTYNTTAGFRNNLGVFESAADNAVRDNTQDTSGTISLVALQ